MIGSGARFKRDLLAYLTAYGKKKTGSLVEQLVKYDFGAIRAALIASIPKRQETDIDSRKESIWGWPALKDTLRQIPIKRQDDSKPEKPRIVIQVSIDSTTLFAPRNLWLTI